ncbi:MAG TPA: FkbM family methyltransferase [Povalibacter sp.]|nr:FkbM family methyltransferase [Povalibacter sp.]
MFAFYSACLAPHERVGTTALYSNPFNWLPLLRAFWVFSSPRQLLLALITRKTPEQIAVRTPIGPVIIALRNFESLKTVFSVFCRRDYLTRDGNAGCYVDVGANIGVASLYFLTRHPRSHVVCFEPDRANLKYLYRNLAPFADRVTIIRHAVGPCAGRMTLYRAEDGKYSSMIASERAVMPQDSVVEAFDDVLSAVRSQQLPVVVKLDVEGLETALVSSTDFGRHAHVKRVICESTQCSQLIARPHRRTLRSGYVEDLQFIA